MVGERLRRLGLDGIGQPHPDVLLAPVAGRLHAIEAQPRHDAREVRARLADCRRVDVAHPQTCVLDDVLGVGDRAEHAIRDADQEAAVRLEFGHRRIIARHAPSPAAADAVGVTTCKSATTTRVHALPWPRAYLIPRVHLRSASTPNASASTACLPGPQLRDLLAPHVGLGGSRGRARRARTAGPPINASRGSACSSPPTIAASSAGATPSRSAKTDAKSWVHGPQSAGDRKNERQAAQQQGRPRAGRPCGTCRCRSRANLKAPRSVSRTSAMYEAS